jgi:hypothetical protein
VGVEGDGFERGEMLEGEGFEADAGALEGGSLHEDRVTRSSE